MAKVIDGILSTYCAGNKLLLTFEPLECVNSETVISIEYFDQEPGLQFCSKADLSPQTQTKQQFC